MAGVPRLKRGPFAARNRLEFEARDAGPQTMAEAAEPSAGGEWI